MTDEDVKDVVEIIGNCWPTARWSEGSQAEYGMAVKSLDVRDALDAIRELRDSEDRLPSVRTILEAVKLIGKKRKATEAKARSIPASADKGEPAPWWFKEQIRLMVKLHDPEYRRGPKRDRLIAEIKRLGSDESAKWLTDRQSGRISAPPSHYHPDEQQEAPRLTILPPQGQDDREEEFSDLSPEEQQAAIEYGKQFASGGGR